MFIIILNGKNTQQGVYIMKRRTVIRILSFFSAGLLTLGGLYYKEHKDLIRYKIMLENSYSEALETLNSSINNISVNLEKVIYVKSAKNLSAYAAEIFSEAEIGKQALSKLPIQYGSLSTLNKFLSQVGNYALSFSKNIISGNSLTEKQSNELTMLSDIASKVSNIISGVQITFNNAEYWTSELEQKLEENIDTTTLANTLSEMEEDLSDYPTLIYDGPYSDHIINKEPLLTSNAETIDENEAKNKVKSILREIDDLNFEEAQSGKIPCYRFSNETLTTAISKKGGYIVYLSKQRDIGQIKFSYEQAVSKANRFLKDIGFVNMIDTYYFTTDGVMTINFAYLDGQTICYTDLIKVGIALDNGEVVFFESSGYITNHTDRAFQTPTHSEQEAAEVISSDLTVEQSAIALIPTSGGSEVRCYEFLCKNAKGNELLIYINTKTLESEQIFTLLKTDGGTLVK